MQKAVPHQGARRFPVFSWVPLIATAWVTGGLLGATPAIAQPIFENVRIGPGFSPDPLTVRGISGGSLPAGNIANRTETVTGLCVGFVDQQPDHTMTLTAFFDFLKLQVESPEDTTLVIKGPGGSWCNDDAQGKNPGIAGEWLEGSYGIWVGSYEKSTYHPYIIRITQVE